MNKSQDRLLYFDKIRQQSTDKFVEDKRFRHSMTQFQESSIFSRSKENRAMTRSEAFLDEKLAQTLSNVICRQIQFPGNCGTISQKRTVAFSKEEFERPPVMTKENFEFINHNPSYDLCKQKSRSQTFLQEPRFNGKKAIREQLQNQVGPFTYNAVNGCEVRNVLKRPGTYGFFSSSGRYVEKLFNPQETKYYPGPGDPDQRCGPPFKEDVYGSLEIGNNPKARQVLRYLGSIATAQKAEIEERQREKEEKFISPHLLKSLTTSKASGRQTGCQSCSEKQSINTAEHSETYDFKMPRVRKQRTRKVFRIGGTSGHFSQNTQKFQFITQFI